jgi:hypothetical protein
MSTLLFEEASHTYTLDGMVVPSVTQILGGWIKTRIAGQDYKVDTSTGFAIPAWMMAEKADFGTALHEASRLIMTGRELDFSTLHDDLVKPINALIQTIEEYKIKPITVEEPMVAKHLGLLFAGTPDLICTVYGKTYLIDLKSGAAGYAGPQTAAYRHLWQRQDGNKSRVIRRAILQLSQDKEKWKLKAMNNHDDWPYFKAMLQAHYLKRKIK